MTKPKSSQTQGTDFASKVNESAPHPASSLVKKIDPQKKGNPMKMIIIAVVIILAGIGSGYGLNMFTSGSAAGIKSTTEIQEEGIKEGDVVGVSDDKSFKDNVEGVLEKGGVDGEGSHSLLREGGPSQTVYLTSSVVDLELFVGHRVEVWGETFAAQKAGWLMDVGRVKVLKLNAPKPFEEEEE